MADLEQFRVAVRAHCRDVGHTQQELDHALGLHPQVLSRKLNGRDTAALTTRDVSAIVTTLAEWGALTTRAEVHALLALRSMPPRAMSASAWSAPPLAGLDQDEPTAGTHAARDRGAGARLPAPDGDAADPRLRPMSLPVPCTPLIGRTTELKTVHTASAASRLVTLTGVGGTGKTRLALQVAGELTDRFPDGVAFVDLAPIRDPSMLATALMHALGLTDHPTLPAEESLSRALRLAHVLLVVDNVEHLVEESPLLARLLAAAPFLHILATSRIPLRLSGEQEIRVPPLRLPMDDAATPVDLAGSEAIQLFIQRARAVHPDFSPEGGTLTAVAAICAALDGLPLAIELAAARSRLFSPEALLPRLRTRLAFLTGGPRDLPSRQQTLRATLDWSYELLTPEAQVLFARLGVFAASFDATAAAAVCHGDSGEDPVLMLERLAALGDGSLLEVTAGTTPRFYLLETLREYALARLAESGEHEAIRERHARYFLSLAEAALKSEQLPSGRYLDQVETERDNLRAAMDWAQDEGQAEVSLRLICAHSEFWRIRGYCVEGKRRAEEALAIEGEVTTLLRAQALGVAGTMMRLTGDLTRARPPGAGAAAGPRVGGCRTDRGGMPATRQCGRGRRTPGASPLAVRRKPRTDARHGQCHRHRASHPPPRPSGRDAGRARTSTGRVGGESDAVPRAGRPGKQCPDAARSGVDCGAIR